MFKLEKVFQNNDSAYILFVSVLKSFLIFLSIYIFIVLEKDTIYDLSKFIIFKDSEFYLYSFFLPITYFFLSFFLKDQYIYKKNFLSFLKEDILNIILSNLIILLLLFNFQNNFELKISFLYLIMFLTIILFIFKLIFNKIYSNLIDSNIIQKNIMIIGNYEDIKKILKNQFEKIFIFKCCIILDIEKYDMKHLKSEIKFPIFSIDEDIRSILEYHALGQLWLIKNKNSNSTKILSRIIKWSVDILIVDLNIAPNLKGQNLLANKYNFEHYEISRFYGVRLFIKIILDKFFSILFLILSSPLLIISIFAIIIEDGFPIIFTQNRTGWDGRRFKIYKLRTLKRENFDKTIQVKIGDKRVLKFGKIIRRYSIDELPQFINVLFGDMSIVGPRPHMVEHDILYSGLFENFLKRHKCNPGLTGWAQVNGLRGATPNPEIMKKRMEYDLWYLNNWTIFLDIYIMFKTIYALIRYKGD
jgi:putative colanic acid biosysnthesis UDP-glucose lipid carrier transferase